MKTKLSVFVFLAAAFLAEQSWAGPHLSILGSATYSKPSDDSTSYTSKIGYGGGGFARSTYRFTSRF